MKVSSLLKQLIFVSTHTQITLTLLRVANARSNNQMAYMQRPIAPLSLPGLQDLFTGARLNTKLIETAIQYNIMYTTLKIFTELRYTLTSQWHRLH